MKMKSVRWKNLIAWTLVTVQCGLTLFMHLMHDHGDCCATATAIVSLVKAPTECSCQSDHQCHAVDESITAVHGHVDGCLLCVSNAAQASDRHECAVCHYLVCSAATSLLAERSIELSLPVVDVAVGNDSFHLQHFSGLVDAIRGPPLA